MTIRRVGVAAVLASGLALCSAHLAAQSGHDLFQKALATERADGNLRDAIQLYDRVVKQSTRDRALAARALLRMAECYQKLGDTDARRVYERVVREFADQADAVSQARARLSAIPLRRVPGDQAARRVWTAEPDQDPFGHVPSFDGRYVGVSDWETGSFLVLDVANGSTRAVARAGASGGRATGTSAISHDGRSVVYTWTPDGEAVTELRLQVLADARARPRTLYRTGGLAEAIHPYGWTPDGRRILVVRRLADSTSQIALMTIADGALQVIKSVPWQSPRASLSPDGRYVAYYSFDQDTKVRTISVLATDGSREVVVARGQNQGTPMWLADSSAVLFVDTRTGSPSLWRVAIDDGAVRPAELIKPDVGAIEMLGVSRSGALYYLPPGARRDDIYTAHVGPDSKLVGRPLLAVEAFLHSNVGPSLSPDGRYLAYYTNNQAAGRLKIRTLATGDDRVVPLNVLAGPMRGAGPMWLPDGRSLLVLAVETERAGYAIHRVELERGTSNVVRSFPALPLAAAISPDGRMLFYSLSGSGDSGPGRIMRLDLQSGQESELRRGLAATSLALSPDTRTLAFIAPDDSTSSAWLGVLPVADGEVRELFRGTPWTGASLAATLSWTPDGRYLLFVRGGKTNASVSRVWRVPAAGGTAEPVGLSIDGAIKVPQMHPDGRRLFFASTEVSRKEVWVLEHFLPLRDANQ